MTESVPKQTFKRRWLFPAIVCVLSVAAAVYVQTAESFEGFLRAQFTLIALGIGLILCAGWMIFGTGLRWRTRIVILVSILLMLIALPFLLRSDGAMNGTGIPRLAWRWTPKPGETLAPVKTVQANGAVDLSMVSPGDYPQFLGPGFRGEANSIQFETDWNAHPPQQAWRIPVGAGWSSFAVAGQFAVTQEQRGEQEMIVCYELATGRSRWVHENKAHFSEPAGGDGPRATPTIFSGKVYAMGCTGILDCLDGATGKPVWSHNILTENNLKNLTWGKSCSPLIAGELVVVTGSDQSAPSLLAYDKETGVLRWKNGNDPSGYSSPMLATLAGIQQIVVVNAESISGHAIADGAVLWRHPFPGTWAKASQPRVLDGEHVFISAGYGLGCELLEIAAQGGNCSVKEVYHTRAIKTQFSSVVVKDGFAYGLDDQTLACVNLKTGERAWKHGNYGYGQLLLVNGLLLIQAEAGEVALAEANPTAYRELSKIPALNGRTWCNPVIAGEYLLVRNDQEAICFKLPKK